MTVTLTSAPNGTALLRVAVPNIDGYGVGSGIGRVFLSLRKEWRGRIELLDARLKHVPLPYLRGYPYALRAAAPCDLVFLPRIMGATALRDTGGLPSLALIHDVGGMEKHISGDRSVNLLNAHTTNQHFWAIRRTSHVVTVSRFSRDRLLRHLPQLEDRISVIHNGVDESFLEPAPSARESRRRLAARLGQKLEGPLLLYVGSESPRKNIPLLLEVFAAIRRHHPGAILVKVGKPDHPSFRQATLETLMRLDLLLGRDVILLEGVDDRQLRELYRAADAFVSASLYEGFGLPALEAMASGTPVVTTDRGAFPEIVGDGGITTEATTEAMVASLETILAGPRTAWEERARERARRFSWKRSADAYLDLMRRLCQPTSPASLKGP